MTSDTLLQRTYRTGSAATLLRQIAVYLELAKARLSALVLVTAAVGFVLAAEGPIAWTTLLWTLLGTALTAGGANGLNQWLEAPADHLMHRTRHRPIPSGRLSPRRAWAASMLWAMAGTFLLSTMVNTLTAMLAAAAILIYVLVYTPLKQRSSACTLVGATVGAIPPLIGAAAATNHLGPGAWVLAAILFIWQIPHSLALAWLYRDDYARGGFRLLVWQDAAGRRTFQMILLYCLALLPVSITLSLTGLAGIWFALAALPLGTALLLMALQLHRSASDLWARRLFLATVIYLPILLALLLADSRPASG